MEIKWAEELMRQAQEIMIKGGELRFIVARRGNERIPEIYTYPANRIMCNKEILVE
jgi:hypothetical protein